MVSFLKHVDKVLGLATVLGREEGVGRPRFVGPTSTTNAMDVVLGTGRIIVVDDEFYVVDVCSKQAFDVVQRMKNGDGLRKFIMIILLSHVAKER